MWTKFRSFDLGFLRFPESRFRLLGKLIFRLFYKVLGLSGASGRGLRQSSLARFILDDSGGHFEAYLGSFLECIFGILYANIIILMHDTMACSMILYDALVYHNYIKHSLK